MPTPASSESIVSVRDLRVQFHSKDRHVTVVNGVSFEQRAGETLCLLGESGSGKSVTLRSLMRLLPHTAKVSGEVTVAGHDMVRTPESRMTALRGPVVSMVFQEPMTSFDPVFTIGQHITEVVRTHDGVDAKAARARALELLDLVQIPSAARRLDAYPHELSGGLRQRAMIALALSCRPRLLLADEPTTALDASVQIQVLLLLRRLQKELGMSTIVVTHDLGVASEMADRVAVMYAGRFVETGTAEEVLCRPQHPYTLGLMQSTLKADALGSKLSPIRGAPPDMRALPPGCSFAPRCPRADATCLVDVPPLHSESHGRGVRCVHAARLEAA